MPSGPSALAKIQTKKIAADKAQGPSSSIAPENDPIQALKHRLRPIVMDMHSDYTEWENALYALIYAKEPQTELYVILDAMPFRPQEIDKLDMVNAMANLGYFSRSTIGYLNTLDNRLFPCLLEPFNKKDDLYVIMGKTNTGWKAYNASLGRYEEISEDNRMAGRKSRFILFKPYDDSKSPLSRFIRDVTGYSWFGSVMSRFKGTFLQIFIIGFVLNIIALFNPLYIMTVYDSVLTAESVKTLLFLSLGMLLAIMLEMLLRKLRSQSLSWLTARIDNIVGNKIFAHIMNLTPKHIENASVTGQIARIRTFESARDFFSGGVFLSAIELPFTIISLIAIYLLAGPLVIVPAGTALVLAGLYFVLRRSQLLQIRKSARAGTMRQQFILETLENISTIKSNGMLDLWFQKFRQLSGRDAMAHFRMAWLGGVAEATTNALSMIGLVLLIGYGTHLIWQGDISTGGMVASMILIWRVLGPFQSLCLSVPRLEQLKSSVGQVNQIMELETEETLAMKVSKLPKIKGKLTFENVSMRYEDGGDQVFRDLSFSLEPGQAMAITGPAGTGKSTIFKMIQGMYPIENGFIRIDDFDIRQLDIKDIRRQVSYIPQIHDFFHGTVADNIRISNPLASHEQIEEALEFSGALADIEKMEEGLYTTLFGEDQEYMSPSFTFQLALARMHVQEAPIVLIDELPNQFQEGDIGNLLYRAIDRLRGERTLLFVTFRRDYLALSDYILTLNIDKTSKVEPVDVLFQ